MSRYNDELARIIYVGRKRAAGPVSLAGMVPWPVTRKEVTGLEHSGGNAEMDLAIGSADAVRKYYKGGSG